ncbi:MAG TPA: DUF456 domain-containing protein [Planctomycetaceae bacterium]|nr:DUF456 domain-containing protein [Planctomycetaceae bacterium]|tara:strand:- start:32 stop:598 length:567 start_codon:yes stop_codon:yes gene_type:complete
MSDAVFYTIGSLVVVASIACWLINLFTLPGNWGIPILAIGMAWFFPGDSPADGPAAPGVGWIAVGVLVGLAILGEILELAASAAGAAKQGASRRAIVLSLFGSFGVSMVGAVLCSGLVPVIGTLIGAVVGGCAGAWGGAYLGEMWKGRSQPDRLAAGHGAAIGRVLGTISKLLVGAVMVGVIAAAVFI